MDLDTTFDSITVDQWQQDIVKTLKGKDYDETLLWKTDENITVKPFYTQDDVQATTADQINYACGAKEKNEWFVRQNFATNSDQKITTALNAGVNSVGLAFHKELTKQLSGVLPQFIETSVTVNSFAQANESLVLIKGLTDGSLNLAIENADDWFKLADWKSELTELVKNSSATTGIVRCINIATEAKTITEQLTEVIAKGNEYLAALTEQGVSIDDAAAAIQFKLPISTNFFFEIAKIRALRVVWANVVEVYQPAHSCSTVCYIVSETSLPQTDKDDYTNLLRATTEAMSAIVGGCNSLIVSPFNNEHTDFSTRIARNIQLILKEESYLNMISDPAGGSYYIESITNELANNVWEKFKEVEQKGGYLA